MHLERERKRTMGNLSAPVSLFVYRRPEHTKWVVERIREVEPSRVLVVGDGPADETEEDQVEAVRRIIAETDWECEVSKNYADSNLGLKERFATGLDWIFETVEESIILEDDTLPDPSFFRFCDELLERYRGDDRVWDITGRNEVEGCCPGHNSYFYSYNGGIWGWATWRSSYEEYDPDMTAWKNPVIRDHIRDVLADRWQSYYLEEIYDMTCRGDIETWDYQWGFARLRNNAVSVIPRSNLVKNIGFGKLATNTTEPEESHAFGAGTLNEVNFPLQHPDFVGTNRKYDKEFHKHRTYRWKKYPIIKHIVNFFRGMS